MPFYKRVSIGLALISILALIAAAIPATPVSFAAAPDDLKSQIEAKNQELSNLENKIKETQSNLQETTTQSRSIEGEISRLNKNINQLNLGIRSAEISVEKLGLEINSLNGDVNDIERDISDKNASLMDILREIQFQDSESVLLTILKSRNLSDGVTNMQALLDLNNQLQVESSNLKNLRDDLNQKLSDRTSKKQEVELQNQNFKYRKAITEDQTQERNRLLSLTRQQAGEYSRQLSALEEQRAEIEKEIEDIERRLTDALDPNALPSGQIGLPLRLSGLISKFITQGYGATAFAGRAYKSKFHNGLDLGTPSGTPIFSAEEGTVAATGDQDRFCYRGAYGKFIVVKHDGLTTLYAHLSRPLVAVGQKINRGDLIGYSGNTGFSTGPHLHFTVYATQSFYMGTSRYCGPMPYGAPLNPLDYLPANG